MKRFPVRMLALLLCMLMLGAPAQAEGLPYTVKLEASAEIYQGSGVEYGCSGQISKDGVYTIVEEAYDAHGNLWGRLKSGAGWILLEEAPQTPVHEVPYTASLNAEDDICAGPGYEFGYLADVGKDGVYTIVSEFIGDDGCLWGRLKSGAGWVRLTDAPMEVPAAADDDAYTVTLDAWVPVCNVPNEADAVCTGIIGEDGVYTIVDEVMDDSGSIWGRLKSGAGWVNLTYVRTMGRPQVTAYFADVIDEIGAEVCDCIVDDSDDGVRIAFRANALLRDVEFTALQCGDTYEVEETHFWLDFMEAGDWFVASVVFYGDMTTYGFSFVDEAGEPRTYAVSLSGMNGEPVLYEYVQ